MGGGVLLSLHLFVCRAWCFGVVNARAGRRAMGQKGGLAGIVVPRRWARSEGLRFVRLWEARDRAGASLF